MYLAGWGHGLRIFDITNSASPIEIGSYNRCGPIEDIKMSGSTAVVEQANSLRLYNFSDIVHPTLAGIYEAHGMIYHFDISGSRALCSDLEL